MFRSTLVPWVYKQLKSRLALDEIKLRIMRPWTSINIPDQLWNITVDYVCEDSRIIDLVLSRDWIKYDTPNDHVHDHGYISISRYPAADGLLLPIRFDYHWLPSNDGYSRHAYVSRGFGGHEAIEVILMLPIMAEDGIECENRGDQFGVVLMRRLLYSQLQARQ
jgi:hypothetical protein